MTKAKLSDVTKSTNIHKPMKVSLDLSSYPALSKLFEEDKAKFGAILKQTMTHVDNALEHGKFDHAERVYKQPYLDMLDDIMAAFFEPEGIAEQHDNMAEREGLKGLGENLHPLAIFTNKAAVYNARGENIHPAEWIEQDIFDLKNWLYALFYGARFVSWKELSEYLSLNQYELVDALKVQNFNQLAPLQEQFEVQRAKGIPVGKLIPGTGKLDLGEESNENHEGMDIS